MKTSKLGSSPPRPSSPKPYRSSWPRCPVCGSKLRPGIVWEVDTDMYRVAWMCSCEAEEVESYIGSSFQLDYAGVFLALQKLRYSSEVFE